MDTPNESALKNNWMDDRAETVEDGKGIRK